MRKPRESRPGGQSRKNSAEPMPEGHRATPQVHPPVLQASHLQLFREHFAPVVICRGLRRAPRRCAHPDGLLGSRGARQ